MLIKAFILIHTFIGHVTAKAVSQESHAPFQGYHQNSENPVIPQWYAVSNYETPKVAQKVYDYGPYVDRKPAAAQKVYDYGPYVDRKPASAQQVYDYRHYVDKKPAAAQQVYDYGAYVDRKPPAAAQRVTNVPSVPLDNSKPYSHYDLSYHDNLEYVFTTEGPVPIKHKVKGKKPKRTKPSKTTEILKPSLKPDIFYEDEVFVEKPTKKPAKRPTKQIVKKPTKHPDKAQSVKAKNPKSKNPQKLGTVGKPKPNLKNRSPMKTIVIVDKGKSSTDQNPILVTSSSNFSENTENESSKARIVVKTSIEVPDEDILKDLQIPSEFIESGEPHESEIPSLNLEKGLERSKSNPSIQESGIGSVVQNVDLAENLFTEEDKRLMKDEVSNLFDVNFSSFVFNPQAQPQEKFQECLTRKNETGNCRYVQHCMLPSLLSSIQQFMDNVCIIQERFIGICCPEFPADTLQVKWKNEINSSLSDEPVETPEECGVGTNKRIVGGTNADRKAWPWMVALLNSKKQFFCGGSLINNRYVLTASHCTFGPSGNQIIARLGEYDFNDSREPHDDYHITEIKRHGQYTRVTLRNDIALLKLDRPVVFNEFVKTVCLPKPEETFMDQTATLVGWGHVNGGTPLTGLSSSSHILQEASFPVIDNKECTKTHAIAVPPSLICAAAPDKDKGACNGDSGGPLMLLDEEEHWKVIGIVSWGRRGCSPSFPTVYTRVTHYLDWIKKHAV